MAVIQQEICTSVKMFNYILMMADDLSGSTNTKYDFIVIKLVDSWVAEWQEDMRFQKIIFTQ